MKIENKVLACVDRSPFADHVADYAAWAARRMDAPLELLHVIDRHPELSADITDCLSGDVNKDFSRLWAAIREFVPVPEDLPVGAPLEHASSGGPALPALEVAARVGSGFRRGGVEGISVANATS